MVLTLVTLSPAGGRGAASAATGPATDCFQKVWNEYVRDIWFYGETGDEIIPEIEYNWLIVRFRGSTGRQPEGSAREGSALPGSVQTFNRLFRRHFSHYIYNPSVDPDLCVYRVNPDSILELVLAEIRVQADVVYAHPALRIGEEVYGTTNRIDVRWKHAVDPGDRLDVLEQFPDVQFALTAAGRFERVEVDLCKVAVWKAADLLSEDRRIVLATPVLFPVAPPVQISFVLDIQGAPVGATIPFHLEIRFRDRVRIETSTIANLSLKPRDLYQNLFEVEYDNPLSSVDVSTSPIRIAGKIRVYAPGEVEIPGVAVYYRDMDDTEGSLQMARSEDLSVRVSSLVPSARGDYQLRVDTGAPLPDEPIHRIQPRTARVFAAMIAAICGAVVCAGALLWLIGRGRREATGPGSEGVERRARERLLRWADKPPTRVGLEDLADFGRDLRAYLTEVQGHPSGAVGGSGPVFFEAVRKGLTEPAAGAVQDVLLRVDEAIATGQCDQAEPDTLFRRAREIVDALEEARA